MKVRLTSVADLIRLITIIFPACPTTLPTPNFPLVVFMFVIVFALMLQYAFRELDLSVYLQVRFDGGFFNLRLLFLTFGLKILKIN